MANAPDDIGLIADKAIIGLSVAASRIEKILFRVAPSSERDELVWIAESIRGEEVRLRARIAELAYR